MKKHIVLLFVITIQILLIIDGVNSVYKGSINYGLLTVGMNSFFICLNIINLLDKKQK